MPSSYDAGLRVGVDGESEFHKSLKSIDATLKTLGSELKAVTAEFQDNADSMEALTAKADVLRRSIDENEKRLQTVTQAYQKQTAAVDRAADALQKAQKEFGENSKEAAQAQRAYDSAYSSMQHLGDQVNRTRTNLGNLRSQLSSVERQMDGTADETDDLGEAMNDASKSTGGLSDTVGVLIGKAGGGLAKAFAVGAIVSGVKELTSAMIGLVDETMEYRRIMASLKVSSQKAGYTAFQTEQTYRQLYAILGDNQTAATATSNLQALGLAQSQLTLLTDAAIGAWATYGDSIPIDSLAESINETIRAGQVTGTFADVINWGSRENETFGVTMKASTEANKEWNESVADAESAEDFFNLALQNCETQAERVNLVLRAMADQGLSDAAEAWRENNEEILNTNEAQADFEEAQARLGEELSPFKDALTGLATNGFNFLADAVADAKDAMEELNDWWDTTKASLMDLLGIEPPAKAIKNYADGVKSAVKHEFEINSPSRWAEEEVGVPLGQGVAEGLDDSVTYVERAADRIGQAVSDKILETQEALELEQEDLVKESLDAQLEALEEFSDAYEDALEDLRSRQQSMADKLSDYGDLFSWAETNSADVLELGDLQEQIDAINDYSAALEALKARGASESLMEEIVGLNIDDATAYTNKLLEMTDDEYSSYMQLWEEKQRAAANIARSFYADELRGLEEEFVDQLPEALSSLKGELEDLGSNCALGLAEGFRSEAQAIEAAFVSTTENALTAAEQAMGVHSPSTVWAGFGRNLALGLDNGFTEAMETVSARMTRAIPTPTVDSINNAVAQGVNGLATLGSAGGTYRIEIPVIIDGKEFYRYTLDDLRSVVRANPEVGTT